MNKTKIEWVKNLNGTQGYTWNPITGCLNGCPYCYARRLANIRLKTRYLANSNLPTHDEPNHEAHHNDPFYPRFWESRFNWHRTYSSNSGRGVFVCDMSDLFGIGIPEAWTLKVLKYIETEFEDRFYLLTKQPQNLQKFSPFPDNCWVGVSATNTNMAIDALQHLHSIQAKVKYLSLEPLLNRINTDFQAPLTGRTVIDWVIIGAQTKPYICPKSEWVAEILQNCNFGGIPVFLKNNLKQGLGVETLMQELPS